MYLFVDTETGGLDPVNNALLEFYGGIYDESLEYVAGCHLYVHPNGKRVDDAALKINGINMQTHLKRAISSHEASQHFLSFLAEYGNPKLTIVAWNLKFDLAFITNNLAPEGILRTYVNNRDLDLLMVARFMLPIEKFNLQKVAEYLQVTSIDHHTAQGDALMLLGVYRALKMKVVNE